MKYRQTQEMYRRYEFQYEQLKKKGVYLHSKLDRSAFEESVNAVRTYGSSNQRKNPIREVINSQRVMSSETVKDFIRGQGKTVSPKALSNFYKEQQNFMKETIGGEVTYSKGGHEVKRTLSEANAYFIYMRSIGMIEEAEEEYGY